ncbi:MAG: hypothetical protein WBP72_03025 [Rhodocyclaceae bacterium]|jgi:hypothetical protein
MSTLSIKDLSHAGELDRKAMCAVRGGVFDQANATNQQNIQQMLAGVSVGNGSTFGGGPATIQVESNPTQYAYNDSYAKNKLHFGGFAYPV